MARLERRIAPIVHRLRPRTHQHTPTANSYRGHMGNDGEEIFRAIMGDEALNTIQNRRDTQYALRGQYLGRVIRLETSLNIIITYWLEIPAPALMSFFDSQILSDTPLVTKVRVVTTIARTLTDAGITGFEGLGADLDLVVTRRNLMAHAPAPLIHVEHQARGTMVELADPNDDVVRFQRDRRGRTTSHPIEPAEALAHLDTTLEVAELLGSHVMAMHSPD